MSVSSLERSKYGPGWFEVLFVAWLGLALGVLLACAYLAFRPVATGAKITKDLPPGTLTYVEGRRDGQKAAGWMKKRQVLMEGRSVELVEDEINAALASENGSRKTPAKSKNGAQSAGEPILVPGSLNFRIHDGMLQIGLPIRVPAVGVDVIVQTRGVFEKTEAGVEFVPRETYVGSLPVHLIPGAQGELFRRLAQLYPKPADLGSIWGKLSAIQLEGSVMKVEMP